MISGPLTTNSSRWLATAVLLVIVAVGSFDGFHRAHSPGVDWVQRLAPRSIDQLPVVIVTVDEESLAEFGQWPWPRSLVAQLIAALKALHPVAIGLDIVMPESDRLSPHMILANHPRVSRNLRQAVAKLDSNDQILASALAQGEVPVVMGNAGLLNPGVDALPAPVLTPYRISGGTSIQRIPAYHQVLRNIPELEQAGSGHGLLNAAVDPDGTTRRLPLLGRSGAEVYPAMAIELLRVAQRVAVFEVEGGAWGCAASSSVIWPSKLTGRARSRCASLAATNGAT